MVSLLQEAVQRYALTGREGASANGLADRLQECEAKSAQYMIATKYIDAFTEITNNASYRTVYFPVEVSCAMVQVWREGCPMWLCFGAVVITDGCCWRCWPRCLVSSMQGEPTAVDR